MKQLTVVCVRCHRGWWAAEPNEACSQCGQPGELRGVVHVTPLRTEATGRGWWQGKIAPDDDPGRA